MKFKLRIASEEWGRYQDVLSQFKIEEGGDYVHYTLQKSIIFPDEKAFFEFGKAIGDRYGEDLIVSFKDKVIIIYDWYME